MRKTFVSLGLAASVHMLPASAHGAAPVAMANISGGHTSQTGFQTMSHAPSFAVQHHTTQSFTAPTATGVHATSAGPQSFFAHQSIVDQGRGAIQGFSQIGQHTWAAPHAVQIVFGSSGSTSTGGGNAINLDLSSTQAALSAGSFLKGADASVIIDVGGKTLTVTAKSQLTPAEYLTAMAVAAGQSQSLVLDARGSAVGGSLVVNQRLGQAISSVVIPQGVTVTDYSLSGAVKVTGNVTDSGNFFLAGNGTTPLTLSAKDVTVTSTGLISDIFAGAGVGVGVGNAGASGGLAINATGSINNAGTISSRTNVVLSAASGTITNTGLVASTNGSITLAAPADLNIKATGGTFSAPGGDINVRENNYTGTAAINMTGGNYLSQNLNINAGAGTVNGAVDQVSGNLNTTAAVAHLSADSAVLTLGKQSISGDPTYANTGDIDIAGPIVVNGANLAIVAGGNINSTSASASITDHGGDVLLVAGGVVTGGGTGGAKINGSSGAATGDVTVALTGGGGGNITFSSANGATASTAATLIDTSNGSGNGGNVTLVALASGANGGSVLFNQVAGLNTIDTRATSSSVSGNVTIIGGASSGSAIAVNDVLTGGLSGGGNVALTAASASTSDGKNLVLDAGGSVISFNHIIAGPTNSADVTYRNINTSPSGSVGGNAGNISVAGGAIVGAGAITANGGTNTTGPGGNGGSVSINALKTVNVVNVSTTGGTGVNSEDASVVQNPLTQQSAGGSIIISASGNITVGTLQSSGGDGGVLNGPNPGGVGGQGGLISVSSQKGNIAFLGNILSNGGQGSQFSPDAPSGGAGGAIILSAANGIDGTAGGGIISDGGNVGTGTYNPNFGGTSVSGNAGEILLLSSTTISTNPNAIISAQAGSITDAASSVGQGGKINIVATDNVTLGIINVNGSAGAVTVISTGGLVQIGSGALNAPSITAGIDGVVTIVGQTGIDLLSVDISNNVLVTGSAFISAGAGSTISLKNGNVIAAGSGAQGEVWVLQASGSIGSYTVNGATNKNQFTTGTGGIGADPIVFSNGVAPTNYYGGASIIANVTGDTLQIQTDNPSMLVPLVSNSTVAILANVSSTSPIGIFTSSNANLSPTSTDSTLNLQSIIALVPSSVLPTAITLTPQTQTHIGTVAGLGKINVTTSANLISDGLISGNGVTITAPNFVQTANGAMVIAPGNSILVTTTGAQGNVAGNFYTGSDGSVVLSNNATGGTLGVSNVLAQTGDLVFQGASIQVGLFSQFATPDVYVKNTGGGGNITFQNPTGSLALVISNTDFVTDSTGTTSFLANSSQTSTLSIDNSHVAGDFGAAVLGGGNIYISSPQITFSTNVAATDRSNIQIDSGASQASVPLTIIGNDGAISTNGGVIAIRPTGDLTFASGANGSSLELITVGSNGNGLINVQGLGNVTLSNNFDLILTGPTQFNVNSGKTITLSDASEIVQNFSGNATFPDPLGGTFSYSLLFQNLISNFNIGGTGSIFQNGTVPGNTVFNDFIDVGFADKTNLTFQNNTVDPTHQSGFINFFTRQIQVNGTPTDSNPSATVFFNFVEGVNFNTNLPSPAPGNLAFGPGDLASSATLAFHGFEPVVIGFNGTTPPASIPAMQQPIGNLNFGLGGPFTFSSDHSITVTTTGTATFFGSSTLQNDSDAITIATAAGSNAPIILGGNITTVLGSISLHADGLAGIVAAGGTISANSNDSTPIMLSSDGGSIGSAGNPVIIAAPNVTANTSANGSVYLSSTASLIISGNNTAGVAGVFSVNAPTLTADATSTITAGAVSFTTSSLTNNGTITTVNVVGSGLTVQNATGALIVAGAGTINSPTAISLSAMGNLTVALANGVVDKTNNLSLNATNGILALPGNTLSVNQDGSGNGGTINLTAAKITTAGLPSAISLSANGASGSTGNGGEITVSITATTPLAVGSAAGDITASANAGTSGGDGGSVNIQNAGNLTVDATKLSVLAAGNGNGGHILLQAGSSTSTGNLIVTGDLHADGVGTGNGGSITLASSSKSPIIVGTTKVVNGTSGAITANGKNNGTVIVANIGAGGVTISRALTAFSTIELLSTGTNSGSVTINAPLGNTSTALIELYSQGPGKISDSSKGTLTSSAIFASSGAGTVSLTNIAALASGTAVYASASSKEAVAITNTNANRLIIDSVSGAAITIKAPGEIDVNGNVGGSTVTVETTGKTGGTIKVSGNIIATGNATILTPGIINISGSVSSAKNIAITANGATSTIDIAGTVTSTNKGTIAVSLPTSVIVDGFDASLGTISGSGAVTLTATKTDMDLNNVSSAAAVKATAATAIDQSAGGLIVGTTGVTLATTSSANGTGSITLASVKSGTPNVSGSTGGAISVTAAGGVLSVGANGAIEAFSDKGTKASIVLENKLITGATPGSIVIGDGAQIITSGAFGSNIDITMGAVPGSPKSIALPTISGLVFTPNTTPPIYLGLKGVVFDTAAGANPIAVNVIGTGVKVVFNTGNLPASAITVNGGQNGATTLIQADPPVVSNAGSASGIHTLLAGASGTTPSTRVDSTAQATVSTATAPATTTANNAASSVVNLSDNSTINAISASRTLYGTATTEAPYESDDAPVAYTVRPVTGGEIDATMLTGQDLGVSQARAGLTEANFAASAAQAHTLRRGALLLAPDKDASVDTAFGQINVAAGAVALVISTPYGTAVYNIDDAKSGSVVIKVGSDVITLAPGRHTTITSHQIADFYTANLAPTFVYRNVSAKPIAASNLQAFSGEFSVPHAFARVKQLRELVNSSNPRARKLAGHMIKTSAIMSQMAQTSSGEQYQMFVPASSTQMAMSLR
jgi:hypothetical protein